MRKIVFLAVILLLAGAALWLASRPESAPQRMPEIPRFNSDTVGSITLAAGGEEKILLSRQDGRWLLAKGEAADEEAVSHLLSDLATMRVLRVVTRNTGHYEKLQVDLQQASRVILGDTGGKPLLELFVGKQGTDLISTYLRLADAPEVLAVDKALLWQVKRSYQGWKAAPQSGKGQ